MNLDDVVDAVEEALSYSQDFSDVSQYGNQIMITTREGKVYLVVVEES